MIIKAWIFFVESDNAIHCVEVVKHVGRRKNMFKHVAREKFGGNPIRRKFVLNRTHLVLNS